MLYSNFANLSATLLLVVALFQPAFTKTTPVRIPIGTQTTELDSLKEQLASMQANLRVLQQQFSALNRPSDPQQTLVAGRNGAYYLPAGNNDVSPPVSGESVQKPQLLDNQLEISGYLDAVYQVHSDPSQQNQAMMNQIELDVLRQINDRASIEVAIDYYDNDFFLGNGTVNYSAFGESDSEHPLALGFQSWDVTAGWFYLPFGLDWEVYSSFDRKLITMPAVVEQTYGWWGDVGMLNSVGFGWGSADVFVVKGFSSQVWNEDSEIPEDVTEDDERWLHYDCNVSGGVRFNLAMISGIESGASLTRGWLRNGGIATSIAGVHAKTTWKLLTLKSEALQCRKAQSINPQDIRGYYFEALKPVGRFFVIGRFDYLEQERTSLRRFYSTGLGVKIREGVECRTEYRLDGSGRDNQLFLQVAAGF
jgi:hypothetical protein